MLDLRNRKRGGTACAILHETAENSAEAVDSRGAKKKRRFEMVGNEGVLVVGQIGTRPELDS